MLTIQVRLLHGTLRASSGDIAMTGEDDPGEWPPSPARLVAALVSADGTRDRCRMTTGEELRLFERSAPPEIYASPVSSALKSRLAERFVVENARARSTVQEYPARTAALVRPGTRVAPHDPVVTYVWHDIRPSSGELTALQLRAARVGYIGCADSPALVSVGDERAIMDVSRRPVWHPASHGDCDVAVPGPGFVDSLDAYFDAWQSGMARRSWFPVDRVRYLSPDAMARQEVEPVWTQVVWLRFERPLPGTLGVLIAETLKQAVLARYQAAAGEPPPVLHGHGFEGQPGHQAAQYVPLPDIGHRHAGGSIHGAAIMLPAAAGPEVVEGVRRALWRPWDLVIPARAAVRVRMHQGEPRPRAALPARWTGPASTWISATPAVHERRVKRGLTRADVAAWCRHAGHPEPRALLLVSPVPVAMGSVALQPAQVFRQRDGGRRPYSYLVLSFERPVTGPMVLGRGRQFGLGLMAPLSGLRGND